MKKTLAAIAAALAIGGCTPTAVATADTSCPDSVTLYANGYRGSGGNISTPGGIFPWEAGGYNAGQSIGAANAIAAADTAAAQCPESQIKLVGYSYGAAVVHTATETIDTRDYADRVHVRLYGNPRHQGGIEDTLQGLSFAGLSFRGAGITPQNVGSFESICNPRDGICDFPHPVRNLIRSIDHVAGYFTGAHYYPELANEL